MTDTELRPEFRTEAFAKGFDVRRAVLGGAHADASVQRADDFTADLQKLVTEFAWGEVWARPKLARRDRSLLNLGMLTALNRPHELKVHLRGALNNGLSRDEIKEVLLQTAVYCGFPACIDAFRIATELFREIDAQPPAE
jgi:4-carboxymuconolactone decarboxylase